MMFVIDALYLCARVLGEMMADVGVDALTNGTLFHEYASNMQFMGISGPVVLNVHTHCEQHHYDLVCIFGTDTPSGSQCTQAISDRLPLSSVQRADSDGYQYDVLVISSDNATFNTVSG
jgi:hypothetical protein